MHFKVIFYIFFVTILSFANSPQLIKIDSEIKYLALKTEGDYLVVINPNYLVKREGLNYSYFLEYQKNNIEQICQKMNASVVFAAEKTISEMAIRYSKDDQVQLVLSEKAIDLVVCKNNFKQKTY